MARIKLDLEGVVTAYRKDGEVVVLRAGDEVPKDVEVGEHVLAGETKTTRETKTSETKTTRETKTTGEPAAVEIPAGEPNNAWKVPQLDAFAAAHGIEVSGSKVDKLAAILAAELERKAPDVEQAGGQPPAE